MSSSARQHSPTTAFYAQAVVSFAVSLVAVGLGVAYLPVDGWVRAFLALGLLFTVTSAPRPTGSPKSARRTRTARPCGSPQPHGTWFPAFPSANSHTGGEWTVEDWESRDS